MNEPRSSCNADRQFHTTHWSVVLKAGSGTAEDSQRALKTLCESYWIPLYNYVRRRARDIHEAQDMTQAFFAELLEKNYVGSATPERGRFRSFLITAFKHFLSKEWKKAKAQKRGGGRAPISLNFATTESSQSINPPKGLTAEEEYDRQWAVTLLEQILTNLESECRSNGKEQQFISLKGFIIGDHKAQSYYSIAATIGMTESAVKMAAHRLRGRYRELLREEIARTVSSPDQVDEEIRHLFAALQN